MSEFDESEADRLGELLEKANEESVPGSILSVPDDELARAYLKDKLRNRVAARQVIAAPPNPNDSRLGNMIPSMPTNVGHSQRLLEVNLPALAPKEAFTDGSWVLSIQGELTSTSIAIANPILAVARITMGSGGATIILEANVFPGFSIQIPSTHVTVDIKWDPPPFTGFANPTDLRISGLVHRGSSANSARRLLWIAATAADVAASGGFYVGSIAGLNSAGFVPPFAKSVRGLGDPEDAAIYDPAATTSMSINPPAVGIDMLGSTFAALTQAGGSVAIPGGARRWQWGFTGGGFTGRCGMDFEIVL